jgi:hypothetical protein
MRLLDSLEIMSHRGKHRIELYHGDLTNMTEAHRVDVLVVSAFPNDYSTTPQSLIGALSRIGINIQTLARDKYEDLRDNFSCWLSREIAPSSPKILFRHILVFEPLVRGRPADVVGDIFQSLMPFVQSKPFVKSIAMPLVATGDQGIPSEVILRPLLEASVNWLSLGLPVEVIKIVEYSELKAAEIKGAFAILKQQYVTSTTPQKLATSFDYDYFISYSHDDLDDVHFFCTELERQNARTRIFMDRKNLKAGSAWQQELYETMDKCARVITMYSPTYLTSKVCKEEYNIALMRHREEGDILIPVYLYTAPLPTYMKLIQFLDCREADKDKLLKACQTIRN